ncbi:MAG TPA: PEP-CTERM sorting domain-containing protein [Sedimentisphaerales bacterium]|nr:PEP-CTERM sorting domain-containing protein [Sedimentisphaerales bacterium]
MKKFAGAALVLILGSSAFGLMVSADADGFSDGTDICTAFTGITLSSCGKYPELDGIVYAWGDGLASTGDSVFANSLPFQRQWAASNVDGFAFRADFDQPADYVAIDIIGDDYSGDIGVLYAHNSDGSLLQTVTSGTLGYGEVFTATISIGSFDIAYIIAGGSPSGGHAVHLDNLAANIVPEPATALLLGLAGLLLTKKHRMLMYKHRQ